MLTDQLLIDDSPVKLSSVSINNSIIVTTFITASLYIFLVATLLNSGYTTIGYIDKKFTAVNCLYY